MKKRVLQFIPSFHQGGSERQAVSMARLLNEEGTFDVYAATLNADGPLKPELVGLRNDIPEFPLASFYSLDFVMKTRACASYLRKHRIDLVHTHDFYTNVFGITAARLAQVPIKIASKRETGGVRTRAQQFVERAAFRQADAIVVNSKAVARHIGAQGLPTDRLFTIYNGVDQTRFEGLNGHVAGMRRRLNIEPDIRLITLVANLRHEVKNVPMFLRAAKAVLEKTAEVRFVIAGEGELEGQLKELAHELGISNNVIFTGRCSEIPALLSASYACVLSSSAEGFPNAILEYMAAGKPVVATRVGGIEEAVSNSETGFIVEPDDHIALAEKLLQLIDRPEMSHSFGQAGRRRVAANFSEVLQMERVLALYNSLLDR